MSKKKISEVIIETLVAAGVKRIYGITGDSLMSISDAVRSNSAIEWMHLRHEETAAFAAGAEAQLTGTLTVCAGSCGPGNLHLINGLYDCQRSRVPVLAIAAHVPSREVGTAYFQETHPEQLFKECSHYCELVSQPEQMPQILEIAMRTAIEKRGVAVIIISGDIALKECAAVLKSFSMAQTEAIIRPSDKEIKKAAELLNNASKVTVLGGIGCKNAHKELIQVATKLQAPIVHTLRGKEWIEYDNTFDVGMTGLLGFSSGYHAMMDSDVLLVLGADFPYRQFYPAHAKIIQVDIRGEQIGRRSNVELALVGDVRETLAVLLGELKNKKDRTHLDASLQHYTKTRQELDELAMSKEGHTPIHPQFLAKTIDELAAENAIFTCDVGTPTLWAARYLKMNGQRRLLGSFVHGSMASALPQAIGAQSAQFNRQVIALCGDGGLAMLLGDILSLKQLNLPVKIIIFNNNSLGFVELEMKAAGLLDYATDLDNPDFAKIAEACGLLGLRAEKPEELSPMIKQLLNHQGPALLDVSVNRQELSLPPTITKEEFIGFDLFLIKAVLNGRGDEIVDLAKTNLFR